MNGVESLIRARCTINQNMTLTSELSLCLTKIQEDARARNCQIYGKAQNV